MMRRSSLANSVFVFAFVCVWGSLPPFHQPASAVWMPPPSAQNHPDRALALARFGQFGLRLVDLTDAQRRRLERNTGAVVVKVFDNTPAFYANILVDDVIIAVNGEPVGNAADAVAKLRAIDHDAGPATVTVLRRGEKKTITVTFK